MFKIKKVVSIYSSFNTQPASAVWSFKSCQAFLTIFQGVTGTKQVAHLLELQALLSKVCEGRAVSGILAELAALPARNTKLIVNEIVSTTGLVLVNTLLSKGGQGEQEVEGQQEHGEQGGLLAV